MFSLLHRVTDNQRATAQYRSPILHLLPLLLILLLGASGLTAQNALEREVAEARDGNTEFASVDLFTQEKSAEMEQEIRALEPALLDFSVLQLDKQIATGLTKSRPLAMDLRLPNPSGDGALQLELVRFDLLDTDFEIVEMPSGNVITDRPAGVFYRGAARGKEGSVATLSIINGQISGLVSLPGTGGNINLVHLDDQDVYLLYDDAQIQDKFDDFTCSELAPKGGEFTDLPTGESLVREKVSGCFGVYFDIGLDVINENGGTDQAVSFLQGAFSQVAILFANEEINITISGITVWVVQEPFYGSLDQYRRYRFANQVNGSVAHYVQDTPGGGLAYRNTLCNKEIGYGMSDLRTTYEAVPNYSWTVYVLTHELGHNFGSPHTQACAWNGNDTPIDACGAAPEGCFSNGFIPSEGGTIMSYCHFETGINFSRGFGDQPGDLIRSIASRAPCRGFNCGGAGGGGGGNNGAIIADGTYNIIGRQSNKALRAQDGQTDNGTNVVQYTLVPDWGSQRWSFTHLGNNVYRIINPRSQKSLDISGISTDLGANVQIWEYVGGANQQWRVESVGGSYFHLIATHSNQCVNVNGFSVDNNANIIQWDCGGGQNDDFSLVPVAAGAPDNSAAELDQAAELLIYPNPASNGVILNLELDRAYGSGEMTLHSIDGREVHHSIFQPVKGRNELTLDVSQNQPGAYVVSIRTGEKSISRRIMVRR